MNQGPLRHQRFYLPPGTIDEKDQAIFTESESLHMISSLRLKEGEVVSATDGKGLILKIQLDRVRKRQVKGRILGVTKADRALPRIHVFQGIVRASKMDWMVEKCTELGVEAFVPVCSERSVRHLSDHRMERLQRISIEAMKQSLGAYLPEIAAPTEFMDALSRLSDFDLVLVAWEYERRRGLRDVASEGAPARIALWIGPEGGFSDKEICGLRDKGGLTFTLGALRLKAETAAVASVAALLHLH